jgi:transitional endoplasmic reticulum ATPase
MELPLPNRSERRAILGIHTEGLPLESDVDLAALADATGGWTGAGLELLCKKAATLALEESRATRPNRFASPLATCEIPRRRCGRRPKRL